MKLLVLLLVTASVSYSAGSGVTIGLHPELHPIHSLYHSQTYQGQYSYGYATPMITRNEVRTVDGMTKGGYSYMDPNGIIQTVQYTSDPLHGFQVSATNLPQDLPDVAEAKAKHLALFQKIQENHGSMALPQPVQDLPEVVAARQAHLAAMQAALSGTMPQPVQDLPEVVAARQTHLAAMRAALSGTMSQPVQDTPQVARAKAEHLAILESTRARDESLRRYLSVNLSPSNLVQRYGEPQAPIEYKPVEGVAQNNLGLYSYGYVGPLSSKNEMKSADGVTRGGYSYIDANGLLQTVKYIADDQNGFRVQATNILDNPTIKNNEIRVPNPEIKSAPSTSGTIQSNRGGFLINIDNSLNSIAGNNGILYTHEVTY